MTHECFPYPRHQQVAGHFGFVQYRSSSSSNSSSMFHLQHLRLLLLLIISTYFTTAAEDRLEFAKQFYAHLEITAHLVDRQSDYPPWLTRMQISYDHQQGVAKAKIIEGHNAGKLYIRRYDQKREYMVKGGIYPECLRSYLGETMPWPQLPTNAIHQGYSMIEGEECEHWIAEDGPSRVHVYVLNSKGSRERVPRRLTDTDVQGQQETPLMTYDFYNVTLGPQDLSQFALPQPYTHESCKWYIGGFPYIHAFHHYLRF